MEFDGVEKMDNKEFQIKIIDILINFGLKYDDAEDCWIELWKAIQSRQT